MTRHYRFVCKLDAKSFVNQALKLALGTPPFIVVSDKARRLKVFADTEKGVNTCGQKQISHVSAKRLRVPGEKSTRVGI